MDAAGQGHERVVDLSCFGTALRSTSRTAASATPRWCAPHQTATSDGVVELLLQCGADANLQNSGGRTALMLAARYGH